jgi:hypothetical protein
MIWLPFDVPVVPDQPEGQDWVIEELSKPQYQAARPTLWDQIIDWILRWLGSFQLPTGEGGPGTPTFGLGVVIVIVVAALIIALLVFGLPRLNRRSKIGGGIFGDEDDRSAAELRDVAARAAAVGDWATAITELFRSIARNLAEREMLISFPGTTAHEFGNSGGALFPAHADALRTAAASFDEVRYLGGSGSREEYEQVDRLERALRSARPVVDRDALVAG